MYKIALGVSLLLITLLCGNYRNVWSALRLDRIQARWKRIVLLVLYSYLILFICCTVAVIIESAL